MNDAEKSEVCLKQRRSFILKELDKEASSRVLDTRVLISELTQIEMALSLIEIANWGIAIKKTD